MSKSNYLENALLSTVFRGVAFPTLAGSVYVSAHTASPAEDASGTEVSGSNYSRVAVTRGTSEWKDPSTATQGQTNNTSAITFPTASGSWGTIVAVGVWDASTSGNLLYYGTLAASKAVGSGDTLQINANQLVISED